MTTRARSFHLPAGDTQLRTANAFLALLDPDQLEGFEVALRGRRSTTLTITYQETLPLHVRFSAPAANSWIRVDKYPTHARLLMSGAVNPASISDSTFRWELSTGQEAVTGASVSLSEEGRLLAVPFPTGASGYEGDLILWAQDLEDEWGVQMEGNLQVPFVLSDGHMPRQGAPPETAGADRGKLQIIRLIASGVRPEALLNQFLQTTQIRKDRIKKVTHLKRTGRVVEIFVLWQEYQTPHALTVSPMPGSTIPKESSVPAVQLAFNQPLSPYHIKGQDGTDRVFLNGVAVAAVDITQKDTDGSIWEINVSGAFATEGRHELFLRDIRDASGESTDYLALYSWIVTPTLVGQVGCMREDLSGTVDGIETDFTLVYEPVVCSMNVWVNGLWCPPGGWSIVSTNVLRFVSPPAAGHTVWVSYEPVT